MRSKFHNKRYVDAFGKWDSKIEGRRYAELLEMQRRGLINGLQRQVKYEIIPAIRKVVEKPLKTKIKYVERVEEKAAHYTCDFQYYQDDVLVIEDAKSEATRKEKDYVLRRKLMKHLIQEQNEVAGREVMRFNEWVSTGKRKKSSDK